jgi:hypothetical protein
MDITGRRLAAASHLTGTPVRPNRTLTPIRALSCFSRAFLGFFD